MNLQVEFGVYLTEYTDIVFVEASSHGHFIYRTPPEHVSLGDYEGQVRRLKKSAEDEVHRRLAKVLARVQS